MSNDRPKGIMNPWAAVEPLRPKPKARSTAERVDLEDIDLDADLAIPGRYVIRAKHASFDVVHVRVESPRTALDVLVDCLAEAWRDKQLAAALTEVGVGIRCRAGMWNAPDEKTPASSLKGENAIIWFTNKPVDQGMLDLARILRGSPVAKKWGVTPMFSA